jgi:hypothetical protein
MYPMALPFFSPLVNFFRYFQSDNYTVRSTLMNKNKGHYP